MDQEVVRGERLLSARDAARKYGTSSSWMWDMASRGLVPKPVKLSARCSRWLESEVDADIARRAEERDGVTP